MAERGESKSCLAALRCPLLRTRRVLSAHAGASVPGPGAESPPRTAWESTTVMYDAEGNALNDPAENMVHIRHRLSIHGEAGDHFERIEASSARRRENGELQSPQETDSLTQSGNTAGTKSSMKASHQHIELAIESETQLHVGHGNESNNNARQRTTPRSGQGQHNQRTDSMNGEVGSSTRRRTSVASPPRTGDSGPAGRAIAWPSCPTERFACTSLP